MDKFRFIALGLEKNTKKTGTFVIKKMEGDLKGVRAQGGRKGINSNSLSDMDIRFGCPNNQESNTGGGRSQAGAELQIGKEYKSDFYLTLIDAINLHAKTGYDSPNSQGRLKREALTRKGES